MEVQIRVMLRCIVLSSPVPACDPTHDNTMAKRWNRLQLRPQGSCRLRVRCAFRAVYKSHQRRAVAWRAVSAGSPLIEVDLSRRRRAARGSLSPKSRTLLEATYFAGLRKAAWRRNEQRRRFAMANLACSNLIGKAAFAQIKFATDSPLGGDGFELLVPRHKSRRFPQHSGHLGVSAGLLNDTT